MTQHLVLVDFENVHTFDLSLLDERYEALIFVGANQRPPKRLAYQSRRFSRLESQYIEGGGRNALDFHIAFHLGRIFETARSTVCAILSRDKGYDPLVKYLNYNGLSCQRIEDLSQLAVHPSDDVTVCKRCKRTETIEHNGGRWCTNCGRYASPPDPNQLPVVHQPDIARVRPIVLPRAVVPRGGEYEFVHAARRIGLACCNCNQGMEAGDGIYDDGEWTCWACAMP